jgi:hypothetical protein
MVSSLKKTRRTNMPRYLLLTIPKVRLQLSEGFVGLVQLGKEIKSLARLLAAALDSQKSRVFVLCARSREDE